MTNQSRCGRGLRLVVVANAPLAAANKSWRLERAGARGLLKELRPAAQRAERRLRGGTPARGVREHRHTPFLTVEVLTGFTPPFSRAQRVGAEQNSAQISPRAPAVGEIKEKIFNFYFPS